METHCIKCHLLRLWEYWLYTDGAYFFSLPNNITGNKIVKKWNFILFLTLFFLLTIFVFDKWSELSEIIKKNICKTAINRVSVFEQQKKQWNLKHKKSGRVLILPHVSLNDFSLLKVFYCFSHKSFYFSINEKFKQKKGF